MNKNWTKEEIQFVKENKDTMGNIEIGIVLGRSKGSMDTMLHNYGIRRNKEVLRKFKAEIYRETGLKNRKELKFKTIPCKLYPELGDCVICISHRDDGKGYPLIWRNGKRYRLKNYLWEKTYGKIPSGMCILHKCDTPECVRLEHLFLGTQADNMHDAIEKGRVLQLTR